MPTCHSCERINDRDKGTAPPWDNIYRSEHWDVAHAYNTSWLGWTVLVLRRHVEAIDELSAEESADLGALLQQVSRALKLNTGCIKTYVMQFAEAASHPHVHFHVAPRMPDQAPEDISYKVLRRLGVPLEARCSEADINKIASAIRQYMNQVRS